MATLYALMGFNSWFFARSDYQVQGPPRTTVLLHFIFSQRGLEHTRAHQEPRDDHAPQPQSRQYGRHLHRRPAWLWCVPPFILTAGPPDGYDFDYDSGDAPIQDDPRLEGVNVADRVDGFVKKCQDLANIYRTVRLCDVRSWAECLCCLQSHVCDWIVLFIFLMGRTTSC